MIILYSVSLELSTIFIMLIYIFWLPALYVNIICVYIHKAMKTGFQCILFPAILSEYLQSLIFCKQLVASSVFLLTQTDEKVSI